MVDIVTFEKTTYNTLPFKFEAGTANYIGAAGMASALRYISSVGTDNIIQYEGSLLEYGTELLSGMEFVTLYGKARQRSSILSFNIQGVHPYDAGMVMDKMGIAIRTGTHCAQTVMQHFGIQGTIRASIAMYNTREELDELAAAVKKVKTMFS
jgi:cysteine desulfurase/selenocysteine lyase